MPLYLNWSFRLDLTFALNPVYPGGTNSRRLSGGTGKVTGM